MTAPMVRIEADHFVAGVELVSDNGRLRVGRAPPILWHTAGWSYAELITHCNRRRWGIHTLIHDSIQGNGLWRWCNSGRFLAESLLLEDMRCHRLPEITDRRFV